MIYNNIDIIPAKIYFKIIEKGNLSLLCSDGEKLSEVELSNIFEKIQSEDDKLTESKGKSKELDIYTKIEALATKYKKIKYSIYYLRHLKDEELMELLKKDGYVFTEDLEPSLDEIERISESLLVKIDSIKQRLPKKKEESEGKETPFDEVVLSYCALLGMGYTDTNILSLAQYRAIIKMGNNKIEALNRNGGK